MRDIPNGPASTTAPSATPSPIYFVRHGQTDWNVAHRFQGRTDIPLNDTGRRQAAAYADVVRAYADAHGGLRFSSVIASPLQRAMETATILSATLGTAYGLPADASGIRKDDRLMEQCYGLWEGLTREEIEKTFPVNWRNRFYDVRTFKADGGESMTDVCVRVDECLATLAPGTLVVTHFGVIYAAMLSRSPLPTPGFFSISQDALFILDNGRFLVADKDRPGGSEIVLTSMD